MRQTILAAAAITVTSIFAAHANAYPALPFGRSITFDRKQMPISTEALRGKMAVLIFFQSW